MKHTIYYVRHGQCVGNVTGEVLEPELDVITDFGRKQAAACGEHYKTVPFRRAYASTYQRAFETAKGILEKNENSVDDILKSDPRIKERELGDLVGISTKEVVGKILGKLAEGKKFNEIEIEGAESQAEFVERQRSFFQELFQSLKASITSPENVLVVSHGLTMRRFLLGIQDGTFSDICTVTNWSKNCASVIENTSVTVFTLDFAEGEDKPAITFEKVHCREHLNGLKADPAKEEPKSSFNVSKEEKMKYIQQALKIPSAKEELSGCVQM